MIGGRLAAVAPWLNRVARAPTIGASVKRSAARRVPALWGLTLLTLLGMASVGGYVVHRLLRAERPTFTLADARGAARVGRAGRSDGVFRLAGSGSNIPLMRVHKRIHAPESVQHPRPLHVRAAAGEERVIR